MRWALQVPSRRALPRYATYRLASAHRLAGPSARPLADPRLLLSARQPPSAHSAMTSATLQRQNLAMKTSLDNTKRENDELRDRVRS